MDSLWDDKQAARVLEREGQLGLRVYSSRLLGQNPDLVLHGGGNTSLKGETRNVFGETSETLFVKGSGWDLKTIEAAGFPAVSMDYLVRLGSLESLSDAQMMSELRLALLDPKAPTPSVEAILHALIPLRFVDHTHTDAVVTLSNSVGGAERLAQLYGDEVLILPYVMPGFVLAKQVAEATRGVDWSSLRGIVLLHHGLFTFAEDAKTSYNAMIELVTKAEDLIRELGAELPVEPSEPMLVSNARSIEREQLARLRKAAGEVFGAPIVQRLNTSALARGFAARADAAELIASGPLTPDHTIHTKPFGAAFAEPPLEGLEAFAGDYRQYVAQYAQPHHRGLDAMPRFGVWLQRGTLSFAASVKRLGVVDDIVTHTLQAMLTGEALGGWSALSRAELFEVEYWELEQAKLNSAPASADPARELEGKVALVTGAGSGIGRATAERLLAAGAAVIAIDKEQDGLAQFQGQPAALALCCDITQTQEVEAALDTAVARFGGLDILVSNAGLFPPSQTLESLDDANWDASLAVNLSAPMRLLRACTPLLRQGFDPAVVMIASKNVPAPGPGAAAYSAAKAAVTQLARVAALELGEHGIRVNTLHPDAVYDTALWSDDILATRAAAYGLSVEAYKTKNVLRAEVSSADVAEAVFLLAGSRLAKTTGAQLPVDGGNHRVI